MKITILIKMIMMVSIITEKKSRAKLRSHTHSAEQLKLLEQTAFLLHVYETYINLVSTCLVSGCTGKMKYLL